MAGGTETGHLKMSAEKESPFACVMDAIEPSMREPHLAKARKLFAAVTDVKELVDGYSFRLPAEKLREVAEFVALERLCCPFFGFVIEVEKEGGDLLLELTGREGVKAFIQAEIGEIVGGIVLFSASPPDQQL